MSWTRTSIILLVATTIASPAFSWNSQGHVLVTRLAVEVAAPGLPEFVAEGREMVVHCAVDPDLLRSPSVPHLGDRERGEHYLDVESLAGEALPDGREEFLSLLAKKGLKAQEVGFVPYAVVEWTERLAVAFAEYRKWPENPHIQAKTLVYAGTLAHFSADLTQPLHTTVHYDGLVVTGGMSPQSGIHEEVDALFDVHREKLEPGLGPDALGPLLDTVTAVHRRFWESHGLVGKVYELAPELMRADAEPSVELLDFTRHRFIAAVELLGSLYLTAWELSSFLELPQWLDRDQLESLSGPISSQGAGAESSARSSEEDPGKASGTQGS